MATTARAPPPSRRPVSASPTPNSTLTRGPTARSAASPRVASSLNSAPVSRRVSSKAAPSPSANGETPEALSASLKQETDQKELLLVQVQNKDQTIATLTTESSNLTFALTAAETRLNELYAEQSRSEVELAQRIDISEKLRAQVRELEKEKRDIQRRYNEQTTTFEAERQAFYDNEQHLKSRIQSLTQARKQPEPITAPVESDAEFEDDDEVIDIPLEQQTPSHQDGDDPETEPAEMTSLRLELSTLSTSYSSLQSTLVLLQTQLIDLKRVNHELQEENESYMILLREKTLSGQFDLIRQVGGGSSSDGEEDDDDDDHTDNTDVRSLRSATRSTLDRVEEISEDNLEQELERSLETRSIDSSSHQTGRHGRKRTTSSAGAPRGESLADLPITGPGLDLAAELGRAENKDILEGHVIEDRDRPVFNGKGKRGKKGSDGRKISSISIGGLEPSGSVNDIDALRTEVKSLKDANKALSLYASKIIDRIISQEGFEHVLAVDYDKEPLTAGPHSMGSKSLSATNTKTRPQSVIVGRSSSSPMPETRVNSPPTLNQPNPKAQRRSLSFDWKGFSLFNNTAEKKPDPNLRPLTLKPGASPVTGGRKLDTQEDEDDRKERERLNATMKLMGIQPPTSQVSPSFAFPATPIQRSASTDTPPTATNNRRFSWFGSKTTENSDASSVKSTPSLEHSNNSLVGLGIPNLTQGALEQAEAENSLAALDAHERSLSAEIARGASSGFTEISPRAGGRRSRRSAGGSSGSTVWSAGMSGGGEDD
ncbi:hypothetical protein FPV67DRAFT_1775696 [Lyophyllum atratum]|nr:hypothetical protein FPV67DRAFT_1775696 [Lyophyllum atratum]